MGTNFASIRIGIIADSNEQQHILRSALLALGFRIAVVSSPKFLEEKWFSSEDADLIVIDLVEQDQWDGFIDRMIEESPATLMFSDGNAPPTYSGKYPRWQKRLLIKISSLMNLEVNEVPTDIVDARRAEIRSGLDNVVGEVPELTTQVGGPILSVTNNALIAQRVWVIGASLGGPAAVKLFLDALEPDLPIAFILAQHIDEGFQSLLGQVLGRNTSFEMVQEFDRYQLRHGQMLIAPADYSIKMDVTRHIVTTHNEWEGPYSPSINQVMRMVAEQYGARSGAIIFSGMGNDGAESAEYMTSVGGKIWGQSADTCANSSQPDSVRETGYVEYNGSPQQLAAKLMMTLTSEKAL